MRAAFVTRYGSADRVALRDVPRPSPQADDVLIRVHAASLSRTDCGELHPHPPVLGRLMYGLLRPRRTTFGLDFAGRVEAVGAAVRMFKPGDHVFGMCSPLRSGSHADYVCVSEAGAIAAMPDGLAFADAVVCEGAYYGDAGLRQFDVGPGRRILIYGASGAIGSAAVQLAKARGAHVTAVTSTPHLALAASLGADRVIDYTADDVTRSDERFDFILDAVGKTSFRRWRRLLAPHGVYMMTDFGPSACNLPVWLWSTLTGSGKVVVPIPRRGDARAFVASLAELMRSGRFRAVIDRRYPLAEIADAYRYVATGQKVGVVVVEVAQGQVAQDGGMVPPG